ncbi:HNH endonuclease [Mycolicibacterium palauense]|uniref:HNH endonuclease n=1 Tax=Mycolicibacterium palauense TaxID=2034511 RepID=UPI000BFF04DD|nr:HNH endonuclease signature motif containing protein [Mycolicibacterium palauense]
MTARPCATCGEVIATGTYCDEHTPKDCRVRRGPGQAAHDQVWRALSIRARRAQPWCSDCGATEDLTADHVIPKSAAPELVHAPENLAVRCRSCNARRGQTGCTEAEALQVVERLRAAHKRKPTRKGRERVEAAQRAAQARGDAPDQGEPTPARRPSLRYSSGPVCRSIPSEVRTP